VIHHGRKTPILVRKLDRCSRNENEKLRLGLRRVL
jgi:hypothetical protein